MINLHGSRWAPPTSRTRQVQDTSSNPKERKDVTRREELNLFSKLLRRLHWKSHHLLISQQQVLTHQDYQHAQNHRFTADASEAEVMFKIDFFEFYVLLERAIIHLLAVFGITVSALSHLQPQDSDTEPLNNKPYANGQHIIGDSKTFSHSFHANVLQALDQPSNPLHSILGSGDVRSYIGIAKEFRNRWKDAEERPSSPSSSKDNLIGLRRYQHLLNDLRLEEMLSSILSALHAAGKLADSVSTTGSMGTVETDRMEFNTDDAPWEAMPDAMDWD